MTPSSTTEEFLSGNGIPPVSGTFPVTSGTAAEYNSKGELLTDSDLDACHGRTSVVPWHGKIVDIYHYDMTLDFSYVVGCFAGTPVPTADATGIGYGPPQSS